MYSVNHLNRLMGSTLMRQFTGHFRSGSKKKVVDPGIQNRRTLVDDDQEFQQLSDYDFDLEADFMNVAETHRQHEREQLTQSEREKYLIVQQKYFKQQFPNFLTWSDKEQMRYLHNTNAEEWTIEKLSESFPALPETVAKIIKTAWTKRPHKIKNHDESVRRNWSLFKDGKLTELPQDLVNHLKTFTNRDLNFKPFQVPRDMENDESKTVKSFNIKVGTEFSEIIRSYEQLKNKTVDDQNKVKDSGLPKPPRRDTYLLGGSNSHSFNKHTTLDNLQRHIQKNAEQGKESADEEVMLETMESNQHTNTVLAQPSEFEQNLQNLEPTFSNIMDKKHEVGMSVKIFDHQLNFLQYPEKILIPKNKWKQGYTYKLNDCYYDDDGEFLYRVPGMYK